MEDEEEFEQWEFQTALEILESDIAAVDTTNVKLVSITSHSIEMYINYSFLTNIILGIGNSFCRLWRRTTILFTASTLYMTE